MDNRPFGTCFFEQYAQITLATFLGGEMTSLVNRDRPDLQSPDGASVGIEVTRAMEESKLAQEALMKDIAGVTPSPRDEEIEQILEYGYAYGLKKGKYIVLKELSYWSMAHPMKRILESKVSKVGNGFYGHFGKMGLFVCNLDDGLKESSRQVRYTITQDQRQAFYTEAVRRQSLDSTSTPDATTSYDVLLSPEESV